MNSKLHGPSAQVIHRSGLAQWRRGCPSASAAIQSGCAGARVIVRGMRSPRDHGACQRRQPRTSVAERVAPVQPGAAAVERDLGRIVGDDAAGAQAGGVACVRAK